MSKPLSEGCLRTAAVAGLAALCFLGFDLITWLQTASWFPLRLGGLVSTPHVSWLGVQKIIDYALDLPLSAWFLAIALLAAWGAVANE